MEFSTRLQSAINAQPASAADLTDIVGALLRVVQTAVGVVPEHNKDMNYMVSQAMVLSVSDGGEPVTDDLATFKIVVRISSKGDLYIRDYLKLVGRNEWKPEKPGAVPTDIAAVAARVSASIEGVGFARVEEPVLSMQVPGYFTELDAAPATVRDVLFGELD